MKLGMSTNEYGTAVSVHRCDTCQRVFTVCPAVGPGKAGHWDHCLSSDCQSYDPRRDFDLFFDDPEKYRLLHPEAKTTLVVERGEHGIKVEDS